MDPSETAPAATTGSTAAETRTQEQARLRRERRNAKIAAGGSARLDKIASLNGEARPPVTTGTSNSVLSNADDPAEVDISQMFARPVSGSTASQDHEDFWPQIPRQNTPNANMTGLGSEHANLDRDDPIIKAMQEILSGKFPSGTAGDGPLSGGFASFLTASADTPSMSDTNNHYWPILHLLVSFILPFYCLFTNYGPFISTSATRLPTSYRAPFSVSQGTIAVALPEQALFWMFATAELMLQSSRYFHGGGQLRLSGWLVWVERLLPEPYLRYWRLFSWHGKLWTTIWNDGMVIVFVLGMLAAWRGGIVDGNDHASPTQ